MSRPPIQWSDGTPRPPRPVQADLLDKIMDEFRKSEVVGVSGPPGIGKSFLARALQRTCGHVDIITSDNELVKQYKRTYPELNVVMGKDNYETEEEYHSALKRAKRGEPTIYNPLSYFYARERGLRTPDMIIVDEAHLLNDMLTYLAASVIPVNRTQAPENARCEGDLIKWCMARYAKLQAAIALPDCPGMVYKEFERIARLKVSLDQGTQNQVFELAKSMVRVDGGRPQKCLVLTPVRVPTGLIRAVTNAPRVLVMSGTMSHYDLQHIAAGRTTSYIQLPYLAPPEARPVYYTPVPQELRKDPQTLANRIRQLYTANPVPTLVHVTYTMAEHLSHLLTDLRPLVNHSKNKGAIKERFIKTGGIWLAAGCSEGLDLPYDQCRQIIIPVLMYPDRSDLFIQKRVGLSDGDYWYKLRTIQSTAQRAGRGVRYADDACTTYILDPTFPRTYDTVKHEFSPMNIIWEQT